MEKVSDTGPNSCAVEPSTDAGSVAGTNKRTLYLPRWVTFDRGTLVGVVATLALALVVMRHMRTYGSGSDFWFLWDAAGKVNRGVNPYLHQVRWLESYRGGPYEDLFLIPAWLMRLMGPLTILPFRIAWALWSVGSIVVLLASSSLALRAGGWRARPMPVALIALALGMTSMAGIELYYGNVDLFVLACLCGCALAGSRDRRATAGVLLGIACALSVQVWALPIFFLWKRNYRALIYTLGTWALLGVASCLWFPDAISTYAEMLRFGAYQWAPFYINQSVYALLLRLFTRTPYATPPLISPPLALVLWGGVCIAVLAVGARIISRRPAREMVPRAYALEFGVALCLAFAVTPFLEGNDLIPLMLVLLAVLAAAFSMRRRRVPGADHARVGLAPASVASAMLVLMFVPTRSTFDILANAHNRPGVAVLVSMLATIPYAYLLGATIVLGSWALWHKDVTMPLSTLEAIGRNHPVSRLADSLPILAGDVAGPAPVAQVRTFPRESLAANARSYFPRAYLASALARCAPYDMFNQRRAALYRVLGFRGIGRNVLILGPLRLFGRGSIYEFLTIGEGSAIATPCALSLYAPLSIGRRVHFGPDVMVLTGTHEIGLAEKRCGPYRSAPVTIGDGTWVGARAIICPGVTIGAGCMIAAGAVVTRNMPPNMLVAGNPARAVQRLDAPDPVARAAAVHTEHGKTVMTAGRVLKTVSVHE